MRGGAQEIILGLCPGENPEEVNIQVVRRMKPDLPDEAVLDIIYAFSILSAAGWPGSEKYFRLYVQIFGDLWASELENLPLVERAATSVQTLRALGMPVPAADRVANMARAEMARRDVEGGDVG
ncbi:hypothetical protein [Rhizobium sp. BK060]|uniref:hypothetical protein n=1 Tax=Rhizobium sp. BK060 TaxID=2587096 RepID=UPI00160FDB5A|nr:hypothetical protein [Rhizobium sp. BK060]MBB3394471.1 hypothetical protein [Rhizobium sp. BK060]